MIILKGNDKILRNNPESVKMILEYLYDGKYYKLYNGRHFTGRLEEACKTPEAAIEVLDNEVFTEDLEGERQRKGYDKIIYEFYYEKEKQKNGRKK